MASDADFLESSVPSLAVNADTSTASSAAYGLSSALVAQADGVSGADLLSMTFDSTIEHVLKGQTAATFTIQNKGSGDAGSFDVDIVLSNDDVFGNADDIVIQTLSISGLSAGETLNQTVNLQLPVDTLNGNALAEDSAGRGSSYVSLNKDFLGLIVDSKNAVEESDEVNNFNQGKGRDSDDITYFPWDLDGSGQVTPTDAIFVINRLGQSVDDTNVQADLNGDGLIAPTDAIAIINRLGYSINPTISDDPVEPTITAITEISPRKGEEMVTLNREAIIRFSKKIDPTTINSNTVKVTALGREISGRLVVSSTEKFVTFFPDNPWNPSTEVRIQVDGNQIIGRDGAALDADNDGVPGGIVTADFRTLPITRIPGTDVFGYVYDSYNRNPDGSNIPLVGVEIRLDALPNVVAVTDENGYFILEDVPAPEFYVYIDGSKVEGLAEGSQYASLGKAFHSVPGEVIQLEMDGDTFDVYLPLMSGDDVVSLSLTEDTQVGFGPDAQAFLERDFPDIDPSVWQRTQVTFVAGSAQDDQGNPATQAMIVPVAPERLPAPLPPFVDPSLVISIQAGGDRGFNREADGGATNFDVPAPIEFPNLDGLLPGQKSLIWTFNHDAGDWEVIGTGTVTEDGQSIKSDEGVGIRAPGWHFNNPGSPGGGPDDPPCLDPGDILETIYDVGKEAANCAADLTFVKEDIRQLLKVAEESFKLTQSATKILSDYNAGLLTTASGISNAISTVSSAKSLLKTSFEFLTEKASPVDKALAISKCIEGALKVADNLCDRLTEPGSPCDGPITKFLCEGVEFARETLGTANRFVETAEAALKGLSIGVVCTLVDDINTILKGLTGAKQFATSAAGDDPIPPEVIDLLNQLVTQSESTATSGAILGNFGRSLEQLDEDTAVLNDAISQVRAEFETAPANAPYVVEYNDFQLRGTTNEAGKLNIVLPANTEYTITVYDISTNSIGVVNGTAEATGVESKIPSFLMTPINATFADSDGEGLVDSAEVVLGTAIDKTDTDGDGISDLAEIQQGLDPLGGRGFPTGIISSLPLSGEAQSVTIQGSSADVRTQTAYVATGDYGLAIVDASQFNDPIVLGEIDLPGYATDVAVNSELNIAAIATGDSGLLLVDVADPMQPALIQTLNTSAAQVEIAGSTAYVASNSSLRAIDLLSGQTIQALSFSDGSSLTGLAIEGTTLYTMDSQENLRAVSIAGFAMEEQGSIRVPDGGGKLFVNDGIAYTAASARNFRGGFSTINVSDPNNLSVISGSDVASPFVEPGTDIVVNGSGTGLLVGSSAIKVMDVSDPLETNVIRSPITVEDSPRGAAIASGIGYVASGRSGLQVVNYLPFDSNGVPPTVAISSSAADFDAAQDGIQVVEGSSIPISIDISDDVQVRNVELIVNGETISNDVSAPFDFFVNAPTLSSGATTANIQVRATDTGGNSTLSNELIFNLVPDTVAPVVIGSTPTNDGIGFQTPSISVAFNESLDQSRLDISGVALTHLGNDGVVGGGDDQNIALKSLLLPADNKLTVLPETTLRPGSYQFTIDSSIISDVAGNSLAEQFSLQFLTLDAPEGSVVWTSKESGRWSDPNNWSNLETPGAGDDVYIDIPNADPVITLSDDTTIKSIISEEAIVITDGPGFFNSTTLELSDNSTLNGSITTLGGGAFGGSVGVTLTGEDKSLVINGLADLTVGEWTALDGASIAFENYAGGNDRPGITTFQAIGSGSLIDFSSVEQLTGATFVSAATEFLAFNGGRVDLSNTTDVIGGLVQVLASGADSVVDFSSLSTFTKTGRGTSSLEARDEGQILSNGLTELTGVDLNINGTGTLPTSQITSYINGIITVRGSNPDLSGITSANDSSFIVREAGTISLPSLTSYASSSADFFQAFGSRGENSLLDLSALTTFSGATFVSDNHAIEATAGGKIDLSNLVDITSGITQVAAIDANSVVDLSKLTSFSHTGRGTSFLQSKDSGTIIAPSLNSLSFVNVTSDNSVLELLGLKSYGGDNAAEALNGGLLELLSLETLLDGTLIARADGAGSVINVDSVTGLTEEELNGGVVNLT